MNACAITNKIKGSPRFAVTKKKKILKVLNSNFQEEDREQTWQHGQQLWRTIGIENSRYLENQCGSTRVHSEFLFVLSWSLRTTKNVFISLSILADTMGVS